MRFELTAVRRRKSLFLQRFSLADILQVVSAMFWIEFDTTNLAAVKNLVLITRGANQLGSLQSYVVPTAHSAEVLKPARLGMLFDRAPCLQ